MSWRIVYSADDDDPAPDELSLLNGLRRDSRAHLRAAGVVSLRQIAAMQPEDLTHIKGIKTRAVAIHAHACAWVERRPVWFNPLPPVCQSPGFVFDIETRPTDGAVWSVGWGTTEGHFEMVLVAPDAAPGPLLLPAGPLIHLVGDSDAAWQTFARAVSPSSAPVYHWTGFDAGVMRQAAPADARALVEPRLHDLHASFIHSVRLPARGASLKTIAVYLGFAWEVYQAWWQAYEDYQRWLYSGEIVFLARAAAYQRDDVAALALVWRWLRAGAS